MTRQLFRRRTDHAEDWVDRAFFVGLIAKGVDGLGEVLGGTVLLVLRPDRITTFVRFLTQGELSEDPRDVLANLLRRLAAQVGSESLTFGAAYLLAHGVVKIVLVIALLRNRLWAYPWMIAVLLAFIAYQLYRIAIQPTGAMVALTIVDAVITALTIVEYRRRRIPEPARRT